MKERKKREVRKPGTEAKYKAYLAGERKGCPFCLQDGLPRKIVKKYEYWYITENLFPYDREYSESFMLAPFRHVEHIWELNEDELDEYWLIRKEMVGMDFDELLENMPREKTQIHYHQHLLKY